MRKRLNFWRWYYTEIELLSYPLLSNEEEQAICDFLADITIIELNQAIKESAISLRRQYRFKLPDALIVATTHFLTATLLTNNSKLLNTKALLTQALLLKS
jgi:predicted nucleic acid-binding protein